MRAIHSLLTLFAIGVATASAGGCAENRTTLYIEHVLAQESNSDECDVSPPGELYRSAGLYDPGSGLPYVAHLVIANQMVPLGDNDTLRPETSRITMEGVEVSGAGESYTVPVAATVHPQPSTDPGYLTIGAPILQPDVSPGSYEITIVAFGTTLGGLKVETGEFVFPVTVLPEGSMRDCRTESQLADGDENSVREEPCGRAGQDGYPYYCARGGYPACSECP